MQIYYLSNSGYAIFLGNKLLVFDYYKNTTQDEEKSVNSGVIRKKDMEKKKYAYVFVSHSHPDHFNSVIFDWQEFNQNTHYMLDKGIKNSRGLSNAANVSFFEKGTEFNNGDIFIKAFGSTDIGVSFYIEADGKKIFHAGDLNCWHWEDEAEAEYAAKARLDFHKEIEDIKKDINEVDLAFFPVDIRIGSKYDEGAKYFIQELKPSILIPMHTERLDVLAKFKEKNDFKSTKIICPSMRGDKIIVN